MMEGGPTLLGPIQVMAVLLEEPKFDGGVWNEITLLEEVGIIALIDAAVVVRESEDEFTAIDIDTELLAGRPILGAIVGGLIGLGAAGEEGEILDAELGAEIGIDPVTSEDLLELAEGLPIGAAAAIAVFEQTWARGLMGAIRDSGGVIISDGVLHAEDLIAMGFELGIELEEEAD